MKGRTVCSTGSGSMSPRAPPTREPHRRGRALPLERTPLPHQVRGSRTTVDDAARRCRGRRGGRDPRAHAQCLGAARHLVPPPRRARRAGPTGARRRPARLLPQALQERPPRLAPARAAPAAAPRGPARRARRRAGRPAAARDAAVPEPRAAPHHVSGAVDALLEFLGPRWRKAFGGDLANKKPAALPYRRIRLSRHRDTARLGVAQPLPAPSLAQQSGAEQDEALLAAAEETLALWEDAFDFDQLGEDIAVAARLALTVTDKVAALDERIALLFEEADPNGILTSVPGVSPVTGPQILARLGNPNRFPSPCRRALLQWAGAPLNASGVSGHHGRPTRRGDAMLREAIFIADDHARRIAPRSPPATSGSWSQPGNTTTRRCAISPRNRSRASSPAGGAASATTSATATGGLSPWPRASASSPSATESPPRSVSSAGVPRRNEQADGPPRSGVAERSGAGPSACRAMASRQGLTPVRNSTGSPTVRMSGARAAPSAICATSAPGPTRRAPTGRRSASIQMLLRNWAYFAYPASAHRTRAPRRVAEAEQQTPSRRLARRPPACQRCLTPLWAVQQGSWLIIRCCAAQACGLRGTRCCRREGTATPINPQLSPYGTYTTTYRDRVGCAAQWAARSLGGLAPRTRVGTSAIPKSRKRRSRSPRRRRAPISTRLSAPPSRAVRLVEIRGSSEWRTPSSTYTRLRSGSSSPELGY